MLRSAFAGMKSNSSRRALRRVLAETELAYTTRKRRLSSITRAPHRMVMGTPGQRSQAGAVRCECNLVILDAGDVCGVGPYDSSDRRQWLRSAFRRTVSSGSCSIRASISLSKARGIVSENSTR